MRREIYFATKRLTITTEPDGGYVAAPDPTYGIERESLMELFERYNWVTLLASSDEDGERIFDAFAQQFKMVIAAGGIVQRSDRSILMIFRNGRWDLPKGHWEVGETIEECAVREVMEESGVTRVTIGEPICQTLHAYYMHDEWELKRTHWFAMQSDHASALDPQREEGIMRAEWLSLNEVSRSISDSFPTIVDVLRGFYSRPSNENLRETKLTL